jgi:hypothetical protein
VAAICGMGGVDVTTALLTARRERRGAVCPFVAGGDPVRREALGRAADLERVQPPGIVDPGGHLVLVLDEEARHAVLDHLRCRALGKRKHRGARRHRLDHDHAEGLGPADRHEEGVGVGEQALLAGPADLADVDDLLAVDVRLDLAGEEALLAGLDHPSEDQPPPHGLGDADRPLGTLLGSHAPDPQQEVVLLIADGPVVEIDRVVDDRVDDRGVGRHPGLRLADADDRAVAAVDRVVGIRVVVERPVHRMHHRGVEAVGHRQGGVTAVVVYHVEWMTVRRGRVDGAERTPRMVALEQGPLDALRMSPIEERPDLGARPRSGRAEHLDVVVEVHKRPDEQRHDELDAAVTGRGHRNPRRRENRDVQAGLGGGLEELALGRRLRTGVGDDVVLAAVSLRRRVRFRSCRGRGHPDHSPAGACAPVLQVGAPAAVTRLLDRWRCPMARGRHRWRR